VTILLIVLFFLIAALILWYCLDYYITPKPFLQLTSLEGGGIIMDFGEEPINVMRAEFQEEAPDMGFELHLVWMTAYKRDRLPEFEGW
jgi:hypothetical protein